MADSLTSSAFGKSQLQDEPSSSWLEQMWVHAWSVSFCKKSWHSFYSKCEEIFIKDLFCPSKIQTKSEKKNNTAQLQHNKAFHLSFDNQCPHAAQVFRNRMKKGL